MRQRVASRVFYTVELYLTREEIEVREGEPLPLEEVHEGALDEGFSPSERPTDDGGAVVEFLVYDEDTRDRLLAWIETTVPALLWERQEKEV